MRCLNRAWWPFLSFKSRNVSKLAFPRAQHVRRISLWAPDDRSSVDRKTAFAFLLGCAVGAAATGAGAYFLRSSMLTSTPDCPLEFGVSWLNTSSGWFYAVESQRSEPRSLDEYNVTFYLLSPPDQYGNQGELVEHSGPLGDLVEATGNFSFEDRGALHLVHREAVGFKRAVAAHVVRKLRRLPARRVECGVVEQVHGSHKGRVRDLEAESEAPRRSVEARRPVVLRPHDHEGTVVRSAVPAGDEERPRPRLEDLAHPREPVLRAHDPHGVVLPDVFPSDLGQLVGRDARDGLVLRHLVRPRIDPLNHEPALCPDEREQVVHLLGAVQVDPPVLLDVPHLEPETHVHRRVDHEAGAAERIPEQAVDGEVERSRFRLVHHEDRDGLRRAFDHLDLRAPGSHAADVAGEGVDEEVLPRAVQLELLRDLRALHKGEPGGLVDLRVVHAFCVRHYELEVVADVRDVEVLNHAEGERLLQRGPRSVEQPRVHDLMTRDAPDVGLDHGKGRLVRHSVSPGRPTQDGGINLLGRAPAEGLSHLRTPVQDIATSSLPPESRARAGTMSFRKNTILMNRPAPLPAWTPSTSASSGPWASNLTVGARKLWRPSGRA